MSADGFAVFTTAIGCCGIAWGGSGIVSVWLPEESEPATRARIRRQHPRASEIPAPVTVGSAIDDIVSLLAGQPRDLSSIVLDMDGVPPFHRKVYDVARTIAPGRTLTYGQVASMIGMPGSARAVGRAMGRNPFPIVVPCHRVVAAAGRTGGFSANGGAATKLRLLAIENTSPTGAPTLWG